MAYRAYPVSSPVDRACGSCMMCRSFVRFGSGPVRFGPFAGGRTTAVARYQPNGSLGLVSLDSAYSVLSVLGRARWVPLARKTARAIQGGLLGVS